MLIQAFNPETDALEKSYLSDPIALGVNTFTVKNNNRFAANDRIMIGEQGNEATEVVTVTSVNADGITLVTGTTVFPHSADDPVTQLRFDQVKFYKATALTGTYSVIATVNLDVDNADLKTKYDDTSGLATYYYKISVYHSISGVESTLTDPIPGGTGWARNQYGYIIDEILQEVSDPSEVHMTRTELIGYFNDVNDDLTSNAAKPYDFLRTRSALTRTAARSYIDFPTDSLGNQTMWKFDRMDYNFTDSTTTPVTDSTSTIKVFPSEEFRNLYQDNTINSTTETDATPEAMTLDTSVLRFRFSSPFLTTLSNVFYLHYWKFFDRILTEGQTIETPTPYIYKLYAKWQYYRKRSVSDVTLANDAQSYQAQYTQEKTRYKQIDRIDQGTPRSFRPMSSTQKTYRR